MDLMKLPEETIDWSKTPCIPIPGETAVAQARVHRAGDVQMRVVEYAPGYLADHWCSKGHVLYVIAGKLVIEHQDGRPDCVLSAGMTWHVGDDGETPHRVRSASGATIFIID